MSYRVSSFGRPGDAAQGEPEAARKARRWDSGATLECHGACSGFFTRSSGGIAAPAEGSNGLNHRLRLYHPFGDSKSLRSTFAEVSEKMDVIQPELAHRRLPWVYFSLGNNPERG